jgi:hypothetical protein
MGFFHSHQKGLQGSFTCGAMVIQANPFRDVLRLCRKLCRVQSNGPGTAVRRVTLDHSLHATSRPVERGCDIDTRLCLIVLV